MKTRLLNLWDDALDEFWLWPTVMTCAAVGLFFLTIAIDRTAENSTHLAVWWTFDGGPDGARTLLSTVAAAIITVAATVFSITIAALTLASAQFGPRLLRNFTHDTGNQLCFGAFTSTFVYCLLVLRTIRSVDENVFVPNVSVWTGIGFGVACIFVLIYFIHHVASAIQAPRIAATVGRDLEVTCLKIFPAQLGTDSQSSDFSAGDIPEHDFTVPIAAPQSGYIQIIDPHNFMHLLSRANAVAHLAHRPGDWVVKGETLLHLKGAPANLENFTRAMHSCIIIGDRRTRTQDIEFLLNQLVEMAMRALSPAINDPFTAIACLDWLGSALVHVAKIGIPSPYRYDEQGQLRLIADPVTFNGLCDSAFHLIRQYGSGSAAVLIHLMETLERIACEAQNEEQKAALQRHAAMCIRAKASLPEPNDQTDLENAYARFLKAVSRPT